MAASFLITLREGLEAALIIGIVLSVLQRLGQAHYSRSVWLGVAAAIGVSTVVGVALTLLGIALEGRAEKIFEGVAMLLAAGVLTWMIFWMQQQGRQFQDRLERDVQVAASTGSAGALLSLAFVAVVREGIEMVLFLTAAAFNVTSLQILVGGFIGLGIAAMLGYLIFAAGRQVNVRLFFRATSVLLLLFAAGLIAHAVHELQEAALLPTFIEHVWDINHILDEDGLVGSLLEALFGYNGNPSLLEVVAYLLYAGVVGVVGIVGDSRTARPVSEPTV